MVVIYHGLHHKRTIAIVFHKRGKIQRDISVIAVKHTISEEEYAAFQHSSAMSHEIKDCFILTSLRSKPATSLS